MDNSLLNDFNKDINNCGIMHSFAKTLPCRYEDIKETDIYGFSFKKSCENRESSVKADNLSPDRGKIKPFLSRIDLHVSNKDILYSGNFGPRDNAKFSNDDTQAFSSIQEENLSQSFLTTTSSNFTSFINSKMPNQESFSQLCQNITLDKGKKRKELKSSEELEIERIQLEKKRLKQLIKRNSIGLEKNRSFNGSINGNFPQRVPNRGKYSNEAGFLLKKRERPSKSKSKSKSKVSDVKAKPFLRRKNKDCIDELTKQLRDLGLNQSRSRSRSITPDDSLNERRIKAKVKYNVKAYQISIRKAFNPPVSTEQNQLNSMKKYNFKSQPLNKDMFKQKMNIISFDSLMKQSKTDKNKGNYKENQTAKANLEQRNRLSRKNKENILMN